MKEFFNLMRLSPLFDGIQEPELPGLLDCLEARLVSFGKGEALLPQGKQVSRLGLLLAGSAQIFEDDFWGNRHIIAKLLPGELFAEAFACTPGAVLTVQVVAEAPTVALFLEVRRLLQPCARACRFHSRMLRNLLGVVAGKNLRFHETLTHLSQRTTREKLRSYLSAEASRQGGTSFAIPFNRQQLADYLCVDRSAMSAELSRMRADGLLEYYKNRFLLFRNA